MPKRKKLEFTEKQIVGVFSGTLIFYVITNDPLFGIVGGGLGLIISYMV
jgi:hypothetical protein